MHPRAPQRLNSIPPIFLGNLPDGMTDSMEFPAHSANCRKSSPCDPLGGYCEKITELAPGFEGVVTSRLAQLGDRHECLGCARLADCTFSFQHGTNVLRANDSALVGGLVKLLPIKIG